MHPHLVFMPAQETRQFLLMDRDQYITQMSAADLSARNCLSHNEYRAQAANATSSFTEAEQYHVTNAVKQCDQVMAHITHIGPISTSTMRRIPWVFAKTRGVLYEEGLPHTREHVVFLDAHTLQEPSGLAKTLFHERMHIMQRQYPLEFRTWLEKRGYVRWRLRNTDPLIRANPDVDEWTYLAPQGKPMVVRYASSQPRSIRDIESSAHVLLEHPYEEFAYTMADRFEASM